MSQDIAPCVCGGQAVHSKSSIVIDLVIKDSWQSIRCKSCGLTLGESDRRFRTEEDAAKAWNIIMTPTSKV
jgi:hypothetical protein